MRVLIPLDGSRVSEAVLPHVARLIEGTHVEVTLMSVVLPVKSHQKMSVHTGELRTAVGQFQILPYQDLHYVQEGETKDQEIAAKEDDVQKYLSDHSSLFVDKGISVNIHIVMGQHPAEEIAEYATSRKFDLIALGTHGRKGISRLVAGSVAERVMELSKLPVLMVHGAPD